MSLWQFRAAAGGYAKVHGPQDEAVITPEEAKALSARLDQKPVWH